MAYGSKRSWLQSSMLHVAFMNTHLADMSLPTWPFRGAMRMAALAWRQRLVGLILVKPCAENSTLALRTPWHRLQLALMGKTAVTNQASTKRGTLSL